MPPLGDAVNILPAGTLKDDLSLIEGEYVLEMQRESKNGAEAYRSFYRRYDCVFPSVASGRLHLLVAVWSGRFCVSLSGL